MMHELAPGHPEYLSFYFDIAARETLCEGAELEDGGGR